MWETKLQQKIKIVFKLRQVKRIGQVPINSPAVSADELTHHKLSSSWMLLRLNQLIKCSTYKLDEPGCVSRREE
jgi:hypothetical protein